MKKILILMLAMMMFVGICSGTSLAADEEPFSVKKIDKVPDIITDKNRRTVLVVPVGDGIGEMGYGGSPSVPVQSDAFAVYEDEIYILNPKYGRIDIWKNNVYQRSIENISKQAKYMRVQNGKIAVGAYNHYKDGSTAAVTRDTFVYKLNGELIASFSNHNGLQGKANYPVEIGENTLIWRYEYSDYYYRYNWVTGENQHLDWSEKVTVENTADVIRVTRADGTAWNINIDNQINRIDRILYTSGDELIYATICSRNLSNTKPETYWIIGKQNVGGQKVTVTISATDTRASAEPFYCSTDGNVYIMRCFEEYVEISELFFGDYPERRSMSIWAGKDYWKNRNLDMSVRK